MATEIQNKYHWNAETYQWERVDRVQTYRGHEIATISTHDDSHYNRSYHREYRVTTPSGRVSNFRINKRGGNIKNLKEWIDFNIDNNRVKYL